MSKKTASARNTSHKQFPQIVWEGGFKQTKALEATQLRIVRVSANKLALEASTEEDLLGVSKWSIMDANYVDESMNGEDLDALLALLIGVIVADRSEKG